MTFSASNLPGGVTAAFNPNPATSTSTVTFTAGATTPVGTYTVNVNGVSGTVHDTTSLQITVTAAPAVTLLPGSPTWGNDIVGGTSAAKSITLTNTGAATLIINNIVASGDFAISQTTCGSTLAVWKNCAIKVTFTPTQVGVRTGRLTITDNAPNSPQSAPLTGTGTVQATLVPVSATLHAEKVGKGSPAKVFTLANKQSVAITGILISTTGDFSVSTTTCSTSLAAKSSCEISVIFTPTQTGTRTGTLQVSDSTVTSPQTSSLSGTGD